MLTESQCQLIEQELTGAVEPRKVGAYLCLHMGLMLSEVCALRWGEIALTAGAVEIRQKAPAAPSRRRRGPRAGPCRPLCAASCCAGRGFTRRGTASS